MSSKIVASAALALVLLHAVPSTAQVSSADAAVAQSLFDEGRKLLVEKKFAEACPRLERSYKLDPAPGTLLNLAVCHEAVGKVASAWNEFRDSIAIARREQRDDREKFAREHADALKARLSTLTVRQAQGVQEQGLEWKLDGAKVGTEALGISLPVDPGKHVVEAVAPGKKPWTTDVEIKGDSESKTVEIPALVVLPPEQHAVTAKPESKGLSPWVFVAGGVAVAGFGVMALGGIESFSKWGERKDNCGINGDANACNQTGIDADKASRTWALVADVGLAVGVAGTAATIILALTTGSKNKEAPAKVSVSPLVSARSGGLVLGGAF